MKEYYGNYLGLCINNDDPEKRGRVQVFIPHIMPALYENWNEAGEDIKLVCVGDNLPDSLPGTVVDKLKKILPWSESALPIMGTSAPGNLIGSPSYSNSSGQNTYNQSPVPDAAGYAGGPSGTAQGVLGPGATGDTSQDALIAKAIANKNLYEPGGTNLSFQSSQSRCGIGSRRITGALLGSKYFSQGLSVGGSSQASSTTLGRGNSYFQRSGYYSSPTSASSNYMNDSSQWKIGDVVSSAGGNKNGDGHIQTYIGNGKWVSDFPQGNKILQSSKYYNYTLHRLNDKGLAQLQSPGTVNNFATSGGTAAPAATTQGSGYETPSTSGQLAAASPHQSEVPIGGSEQTPSRYGNIADPNVQSSGTEGVNTASLNLTESHKQGLNSFLQNYRQNQSQYEAVSNALKQRGITMKPSQVAAIHWREASGSFTKSIANGERLGTFVRLDGRIGQGNVSNSYKPTTNWVDHSVDVLSHKVGQKYGGPRDVSSSTAFNDFAERFNGLGYRNRGRISPYVYAGTSQYTGGKYTGDGVYNPNVFDKQVGTAVLAAAAEGTIDTGGIAATASVPPGSTEIAESGITESPTSTQMVQNQDPHGTTAVLDINNMSAGMFAYPAAGALLWCFFREGNPLYPVYFAASYGQAEWQSAYRYNVSSPAQPGVSYKPAADESNPVTSVGGRWNIGKVGALVWDDTTDPNDPKNNQKSLMLAGHDGSNIFFNEGYHQIFSKFDRRDQVEGDRWETTLGYKEEWVQGDSNLVVMGNMYVKIGNVGPEAVEAVENIQQIIRDSMQPLTESSSGGNSGGSSGSKSKYTKDAEKNAIKNPIAKDLKLPPGSPLSRTNSVAPVSVGGGASFAPAPTIAPSSAAARNPVSTAVNPAVGNPFAQGSSSSSQIKFVPSTGFKVL
jgi:lysozyme family protein